jgi:hypothetical protein
MDTLLLAAVAGLLVFVVARFVKVRLSLLGYLGAGVLAVFVGWLVRKAVHFEDPLVIRTDWTAIPVLTLAIGALAVGLLLKVARPLR